MPANARVKRDFACRYAGRLVKDSAHDLQTRILLLAFASCTNTDFQTWEGGNSMVQGHGGTRKVVDVWTHGDPPRRFKVLGIIEDERPGGMIPTAQLKHDIVQKARQNGGNAIIFVSSASQLAGYYTASSASAYGYGNSATAFVSSTTIPITRRSSHTS
jgi:hypothetical protein